MLSTEMSRGPQAPGAGTWFLQHHWPRPVTPMYGELMPCFSRGYGRGMALHGIALETVDMRTVDGFVYGRPRLVGTKPDAPFPSPVLLFLLTRLHPAFRARVRTASRTSQTRPWRAETKLWNEVIKPRNVAKHRAFQSVEVEGLEDDALVSHLRVARDHLAEMMETHGRFTVASLLPVGAFLAHVASWTDEGPGAVLSVLQGSAPVSAGRSAELSDLAGELLTDAAALRSLDAPASAREILASLTARTGAVGSRARAYLELVGYRIVAGYDPGEPYGHEVPHVMLACIRAALAARNPAAEARRSEEGRDLVSDLRRRAPSVKRARFDDLIEEARSVSELRDERVLYSDAWASGILRRAILEIGARLARRGLVERAPAAVDASFDELVTLLRTGKGVTSATLSARAHRRQSRTVGDVPDYLGARPEPPPPVERFPRRSWDVEHAWAAAIQSLVLDGRREHDAGTFRVIGVSRGIAVGRVRHVRGSADLARIELGDVLVTATTSSAFNVFLPLLAAIVTDRGGALSHAAIVAREYGIPGVVGTRDASQRLAEGTRVRVDGGAGEVHLL